jgi:radical SAM-linked protein
LNPSGQEIAQKVQLRFSKSGDLRFLSHHDMMRLFARACRRAALPVRLTQGFDPRPRLVFATALELGVESLDEALEMELSQWINPENVRRRLQEQLPEGIRISEAKLLPPRRSGLRPVEMIYRVSPPGGASSLGLTEERLREFLSRRELIFDRPRERRVQRLDLRPSVVDVAVDGADVVVNLRPTAQGAARPAEVLAMLTDRPLAEIRRWPVVKTAMRMAP